VQAYLESKPADLGDRCVNFEIYGRYGRDLIAQTGCYGGSITDSVVENRCRAGYKCRYLNAHLKDGKLVVDEEVLTVVVKPNVFVLESGYLILYRQRVKNAPVTVKNGLSKATQTALKTNSVCC
jgi:hypothetical protein